MSNRRVFERANLQMNTSNTADIKLLHSGVIAKCFADVFGELYEKAEQKM